MKFQPRRRLGKFLMAVSVVFLILALHTFFFYETKSIYVGPTLPMPPTEREQYSEPQHAEGAALPSTHLYTWPYRWLSQPLAMIGISLFLTGLFVGFHDDISEILSF